MNILRFLTSVPLEVALASPQGTLVQGRYGDRMMFNLTDGQVMYVPPIVANTIEAEGIGPGEPFELCKSQVKTGQRRSIEWPVRRIDSERAAQERSAAIESPETQLESDLRSSVAIANGKNGKHPATDDPPPNLPLEEEDPPAKQATQPLTKLESALKTAIAAAHNAEKFGAEIGYVVRFDSDAINHRTDQHERGEPAMGELSTSPPSVVDSDLAAILSPSQVRCFMDCQVRWWFKYGLKYPDPPNGKMVLGRAVHAAKCHQIPPL